ncbi:MAG TPA: metal ABC transporter permease [Lacisediminihabitans sp.]|uniref:metal ABC transporter permease n=1 Tax=Lacisediminihabitans sp. TaxID=2787631 RepID=UPI002EDA4542
MMNTWISATIVALIAGIVGFFVVLRGSSFLAHALPHGAFAGAAGATLIGVNPVLGMGIFAVAGALTVTTLGRRGRNDVVTALALVAMLGLGALFLSLGSQYSAEVYALLFGQILGVSSTQLLPILVLGIACVLAIAIGFRPLMLSSVLPDMAAAKGIGNQAVAVYFSLVVALATAMSVPVVGALLMFSLLVGPPAAARSFTSNPGRSIALSVAFALVTVWAAIAAAYLSDWPVGFFVTAASALLYGIGRGWFAVRTRWAHVSVR